MPHCDRKEIPTSPRPDAGCLLPVTPPADDRSIGGSRSAALCRLNRKMDRLVVPLDLNEPALERLWTSLAPRLGKQRRKPLLLAARLAELTLICAGNAADCGAFPAAGDLLFNPRKIEVWFSDGRPAAVKQRHGSMTEQFRRPGERRAEAIRRMGRSAIPVQKKPPLFSRLYDRLASSALIRPDYLGGLAAKAKQVSATIGFMAAWGLTCPEAVWQRRWSISVEQRRFFESNLCRFSAHSANRLGDDFRNRQAGRPVRSAIFRTP